MDFLHSSGPAMESYRLTAVYALLRNDVKVYEMMAAQPGVGRNPKPGTYIDIDSVGYSYRLAHILAVTGSVSGMRALVKKGRGLPKVDHLDDVTEDGMTALHLAVTRVPCHAGLAQLLLDAKANPNIPRETWKCESDDTSPLISAASRGDLDMVALLLEHDADVKYRRSRSKGKPDTRSALDVGCASRSSGVVRLLLRAGADPNQAPTMVDGRADDTSPLILAADNGDDEIVVLLLAAGARASRRRAHAKGRPDDRSALDVACRAGQVCIVSRLLEAGASPSATPTLDYGKKDDTSPLMEAARKGVVPIVEGLLKAGVDATYRRTHYKGKPDDRSAVDLAAFNREVEIVEILSTASPDVLRTYMSVWAGKPDNSSPLMAAVSSKDWCVVKVLLQAGADVNYRRTHRRGVREDWTALDVTCAATQCSSLSILRNLCDAGADVNGTMSYANGQQSDFSPLMCAVKSKWISAVELLLSHGADPSYRSTLFAGAPLSKSVLHVAEKDEEAVAALCWAGANANPARADDVAHPLVSMVWLATLYARLGPVIPLLMNGADPFVEEEGEHFRAPAPISYVEADPSLCVTLDSRPSVL